MTRVQIELKRRSNGSAVLRLTSDRPVSEPFVDLVVDANWNTGRLTRSYTMLFDPPTLRKAPVEAVAKPEVTAPARPAESAPSRPSPARSAPAASTAAPNSLVPADPPQPGAGPRQGSQQCCSENNQYARVQPGGQQRQNVEQCQREAGANECDRWPKPRPQGLPREAGGRKANEEAIAEAARAAHRPSAWSWPSSAAGTSQAGSRCQDNSACQGIRSRTTA